MSRLGGAGTTEWTPPPPLGVWCRRSGPTGHCLQIFLFTAPRNSLATGGRRAAGGLAETHYHTHTSPARNTANAGAAAGVVRDLCLGAATSPCFRGGAPTRRRTSPGSRLGREAGYSRVHGVVRSRGLHNSFALQRLGASLFAVAPDWVVSRRRACTAWALRCAAHDRPIRHKRAAVSGVSTAGVFFLSPCQRARIHLLITRRSNSSMRGWPRLSRRWWPVTAMGAVGARGAIRGLARAPAAPGAARSRFGHAGNCSVSCSRCRDRASHGAAGRPAAC